MTEAVIENPNRSNDYISVSAVADPELEDEEEEDPNTLSTSTGCSTSPG